MARARKSASSASDTQGKKPRVSRRKLPAKAENENTFVGFLQIHLCEAISGFRCWRQNSGTVGVHKPNSEHPDRYFHAGPPPGCADISGIWHDGRRVEIELKKETGRSTAQENWARMIVSHGGIYLLFLYNNAQTLEQNLACAVGELANAAKR